MNTKIINTIILSLKGYSLLRIYQIHACKAIELKAKSIEFGAYKEKNKNFSIYFKGDSQFIYSNFYNNTNKNYLKIDLTKRLKIKKNEFNNVIIMNVLEHLPNFSLTFKEINRVLKSNGSIIGSTPFIYPVHGAPNDYYRFTKEFFNMTLKKNKFKKIKINALGFGPFIASYNLIYAYIKFFPLFKELILLLSYAFDFTIQLFVKTKLKEIYPIGFYFTAKK
jgi:SAM-dependent methyltransferase